MASAESEETMTIAFWIIIAVLLGSAALLFVLTLSGWKPGRRKKKGGEHHEEPDAHPPAPAHGAGGGHDGHHGPGPFGKTVVFGLYLVMLLGAGWVGVQIWTAAKNAPMDGHMHAGQVVVQNATSAKYDTDPTSACASQPEESDTRNGLKVYPASPDTFIEVGIKPGFWLCPDLKTSASVSDLQCRQTGRGAWQQCTGSSVAIRFKSTGPQPVWFDPYKRMQ